MTSVDFADIKPGQWHDFMFHFSWSHGSDGLIEIRHQTSKKPGWQTVPKTGPNTYTDNVAVGTSFAAVDPTVAH